MTKTYMELISTSRIRPKVIAVFARAKYPISLYELAAEVNENAGSLSVLLRGYVNSGFLNKEGRYYTLGRTDIREELIALTSPVKGVA